MPREKRDPTPRNKRPPTPRMIELVEAIEQLTKAKGYAPSLAELGEKLNVTKARAQFLARGARDRGVVRWEPRVHRSIKAIDVRQQRPSK